MYEDIYNYVSFPLEPFIRIQSLAVRSEFFVLTGRGTTSRGPKIWNGSHVESSRRLERCSQFQHLWDSNRFLAFSLLKNAAASNTDLGGHERCGITAENSDVSVKFIIPAEQTRSRSWTNIRQLFVEIFQKWMALFVTSRQREKPTRRRTSR